MRSRRTTLPDPLTSHAAPGFTDLHNDSCIPLLRNRIALNADHTERQATVNATYTVNCSILLTDLPLLDRPRAAKDAGFDAVEFWWPFADPVAVRRRGRRLHPCHPGRGRPVDRPELRRRGHAGRRAWNPVQSRTVAGLPGQRRHRHRHRRHPRNPGLQRPLRQARRRSSRRRPRTTSAADNLAYAAAAADRIGATVLLEPVSGAPHYPLKTAADVMQVIDRVRAETRHHQPAAARRSLPPRRQRRRHQRRHSRIRRPDRPRADRRRPGTRRTGNRRAATGRPAPGARRRAATPATSAWSTRPPDRTPSPGFPADDRGADAVNIETLLQQQETRIS